MLTITDLFCGAGGSSSGAEQVPGVRVRMAANHWALAVETHLRPVLVEIGATLPTRGLYVTEADLPRLDDVIAEWLTAAGPALRRALPIV